MSEATLLRRIRRYCIACMGTSKNAGYRKMITECASRNCDLWPNRFGESIVVAKRKGRDVKP
jgi:hypothetical protein